MRLTLQKLTLVLALAVVLSVAAGRVSATDCFVPAPVVSYYPAVSYYPPAPVVSYYAPPAVSYYYAPQPAPVVTYYSPPAPVVSYYYAPAPVVAAPTAVTTTYRYGLFQRRQATVTRYYPPVVYYP